MEKNKEDICSLMKKKFKYLIYVVIYFLLIILMATYFYKNGISLI